MAYEQICHEMGWLAAQKQFSINFNPSQKVTQKVKTVRYLFTIELIDGTLIHLISEFFQTNLLVIAKFYVLPQPRFR